MSTWRRVLIKPQGMLEDYVVELEGRGCAGSYIHNVLKPVRSWLNHNGMELKRRIKVSAYNLHPKVAEERVPTKEELARIFRHLSPRGRAYGKLPHQVLFSSPTDILIDLEALNLTLYPFRIFCFPFPNAS